jgi:ribosomal protein S18 acetylase RimI-like enzyme
MHPSSDESEPTVRASSDTEVLPRVLEILYAAFTLHDGRVDPPSGVHRETVAALAARFPAETLLLAEVDGGIAGCIWCEPQGDDVYVGRLAVDPELHGRGVGRALLLASIDWARTRGAARVTLSVRRELVENIAFFERHGFRIVREQSHPGYDRTTFYDMALVL